MHISVNNPSIIIIDMIKGKSNNNLQR